MVAFQDTGALDSSLSSYADGGLPVNWSGIALILLALVFFVVDLKVTSHGVPTVGGIVALVLGGLMLFDTTASYSWIALIVLVALAIPLGILFVGGVGETLAARGRPVETGAEGMIGEVGVVREPVGPGFVGWVFVHGELWQAVAAVAPEDAHKQDRERVMGFGRRVQVVGLRDGKVVVLSYDEPDVFEYPSER